MKKEQKSQCPLVSVNLVVHNGEKYIRQCLGSVLRQTHKNIEVNILDNASTDKTLEIIKLEIGNWKLEIPNFSVIQSKRNWGTWLGQEELLKYSRGEYIVALSVDVVLDPHFIEEAVRVFKKDPKIGAIQGKIYKYEFPYIRDTRYKILDTAGFQIFRSRRIINIGHGQEDRGQFSQEREIFAAEGAAPVLRRQALEDCRLVSQVSNYGSRTSIVDSGGGLIIDPDFFWYGDDLDLAWRMRLFGWKQVYAPMAIAYHDRQTTKALAGGGWREFIKIRKTVPMFKRRLDWRNTTLAIIKNDFTANFLRDLPLVFWRQLRLWVYFLLFEPSMFLEIFRVAKMLPKMLKRRSEIMRKARVSAKEMRKWFV